jgi:hypothetical protein
MPVGVESCDLDGAQTEGWVFHYLDTQPSARASCRGTIERELWWPAHRVDPLFIHPILDRPRQFSPHGRFELQARAQPLPRPNHQRKISPKQHINRHPPFRENQLWKPAPLAHAFQRTKDRAPPLRMSPNLSIVFTKHLNSAATMPGRTVRRKGSQETGFRTPAEAHWGGEKQRMGGTSTSMACKHTRKIKRYLETSNQRCSHQAPNPLP